MTGDVRILGEVRAESAEDPLGAGDPLEIARLVRRALAAARHRATDVAILALVTDEPPDGRALSRFTRRALGPHGAAVSTLGAAARGSGHQERIDLAAGLVTDRPGGGVAMLVVRGPGPAVTVRCVSRPS